MSEPEFGTNTLVPELCKRFSGFNPEPVPVQVFLVLVLFEEFLGVLADPLAHGDAHHADDIAMPERSALLFVSVEIGDTQVLVAFLARE